MQCLWKSNLFHQIEYRPPPDSILFDEDEDQLFSFQKALCGPLLLKEAEEAEEIQPNETFKLAVNKYHLHAFILYNTILSIL